MIGIFYDTISELINRKTFIFFIVVTVLSILIVLGMAAVSGNIEIQMNGDVQDLNQITGNPILQGFAKYVYFLVFLSVMAMAGLIPNTLVKGRADYYLSKPYSKTGFLFNKFLSVWVVYGFLILASSTIIYLTMYLVYDFLSTDFIYIYIYEMLHFFIWLAVAFAAGILSNSTVMTFMSVFIVWVLQRILQYYEEINSFFSSEAVKVIIKSIYYIVPKTGQVSDIGTELALGNYVLSYMPLYSSLIFAVVLLIITAYIFKRKDY